MPTQNPTTNSASAFIASVQKSVGVNANNVTTLQQSVTKFAFTPNTSTGSLGISTPLPSANLHVTSKPLLLAKGLVSVVVGPGQPQEDDVVLRADTAGDLNNTYWFLYSPDSRSVHYVWYNVAAGGSDPAPSPPIGVTAIVGLEVAIGTNDTAIQVADATRVVLDGTSEFNGGGSTATVNVTRTQSGWCRPSTIGTIGAGWSTSSGIPGLGNADVLGSRTSFDTELTRDDSILINSLPYTVAHVASDTRIVLDSDLPASVTDVILAFDNDLLKVDASNNVNLFTVTKSGHIVSPRLLGVSYSDDTVAASDGVPVGALYRAGAGHPTASVNSITIRLV